MKLYYFSWIRENLGLSHEIIKSDSSTIDELIIELRKKDERYQNVFKDMEIIKIAVDQILINDLKAKINDNSEVAFFPPMTGG